MSDSPRRIIRVDLAGLTAVRKPVLDRAQEIMIASEACGFDAEIDLRRSEDQAIEGVIIEEAGEMLANSQIVGTDLSADEVIDSDQEKLLAVAKVSEAIASMEKKKKDEARKRMADLKAYCWKLSIGLVVKIAKDAITKTNS